MPTYQWYIDGVEVDEQIVMRPNTQTIDQILNEENMEVRRVRIERYGAVNFLREAGAFLLDQRSNNVENTEEALYGIGDQKFLVATCPTGRVFCMEVPTRVQTCQDAQSYLAGDGELPVPPGNPIGRS